MSRQIRRIAILAALLAGVIAMNAHAGERPGAGTSLGIGVLAYDPSPVAGRHVALPALEIAAAPGGHTQLRLRTPVLESVYNAALRHQMLVVLDVMLLFSPLPEGKVGLPQVMPRLGPMLGFQINAGHEVVQPGMRIGGRFGGELMDKGRQFGFFFGIEPLLEIQGGTAGVKRQNLTVGGGALFTIALTGYRKP